VKFVVTGAGGMLAQELILALASGGHVVEALTHADLDVVDGAAMTRRVAEARPDWVCHLAAFTKVDECESRPEHAFLVNEEGARHAAGAAAACGAGVLAVSTDYIFDGEGQRPYREDDAAAPRSVYGASKWAGEQAVRATHPRHVIVRTSWLFGRGGPNFIDTILEKARAGEALRVVDDQRGSPTWTRDLAGGLVRLMGAGRMGTFHCTNGGDCTWYELAAHALDRAGVKTALEPTDTASFPRPARRPAYSVLDNSLYQQTTGHHLPHWRDAVERYLQSVVPAAAGGRGVAT
jgi:dTDP-4-dehydrorhamnose reductase